MKVGIYTPYSLDDYGGPTNYIINLINQLLSYDEINVYLISEREGNHPLYKELKNIKLSRIPVLNSSTLKKYDLDIVHFNKFPVRPENFLLTVSKSKNILTVHGDEVFSEPQFYGFNRYHRLAQPIVSKRFDRLITVSYNLRDRLIDNLKIPKDKTEKVYHGVDHNLFKPRPDAKKVIENKYGIKRDFILHLSNYMPLKNPSTLIKTFEHVVNDFDLDLVIIGKGWKNKFLELETKSSKIRERVRIIGNIPQKDTPFFYSAAELFLFPTYHETFGFPNVEAMACKTPVVTSNVTAVPEVTGDAAILCNPNNVSEFVGGVRSVLENNAVEKKMIKKGLENAKRFTWEKCAKQTVKIYREVLNDD